MILKLIFNYLSHYWVRQSRKEKLLIIVIALFFCFGIYHYSGKLIYKYKYFKAKENEVIMLRDSISLINSKEAAILSTGRESTVKTAKKANKIDTKLKEDEKTIDNSDVTDAQLRDFLSKYN